MVKYYADVCIRLQRLQMQTFLQTPFATLAVRTYSVRTRSQYGVCRQFCRPGASVAVSRNRLKLTVHAQNAIANIITKTS